MMKFIYTSTLLIIICLAISCQKKGCTDPYANNYSEGAKKDDNSCDYGSHPIHINSWVGFEYTLNNETIKSEDLNHLGFSFGFSSRFSNIDNYFQSSSSFSNTTTRTTYFSILRSSKQLHIPDDEADFQISDFSPGNYPYLDINIPEITTGKYSINIHYNNQDYTSVFLSQDSYFKILKSKPDIHYDLPGFKILCEFSCDLVSYSSPSDTVHISNGRALFFLWKKRKH